MPRSGLLISSVFAILVAVPAAAQSVAGQVGRIPQATDEDLALLDSLPPEIRERTLALWAAAGLLPADEQGAPSIPIAPQAAITPVAFVPAQGVTRARLPVPPGYPQPSILVGLPGGDVEVPAEEPPPAESLAAVEVDYSDPAARTALRDENPELFASLLASGTFDPPEEELTRAIQAELARMGCYRSTIDGIWGNGSRAAVQRYFDEAGGAAVTLEPEPVLFRALLSADVDCPAPAPQQTASRPAAPSGGTTAARPAAPTPPPAAQPSAPASSPRINTDRAGTGVFR